MKKYLLRALPAAVLTVSVSLWLMRQETGAPGPADSGTVPSGAMQALDFWSAQRAYPNPSIPDDSFFRAFEHSRLRIARATASVTEDVWESIGPGNQGGRTIALAVDPQNPDVIYAGSASGGLWRLTMEGTAYSWEHIDTGHPVLGVNAIAVHPFDSDILYIGTGEVYAYQNSIGGLYDRTTRGSYGIGLLKTTDRGKSWEKVIDWSYHQQRGVLALEIHPRNPEIVFAGTSEGTYRTTDAGETWDRIHDALMAVDLAVNPTDPDIVYVSCGNMGSAGTGIYRSSDGGDPGTWTRLAGGLPSTWTGKTMLCIFRGSPNILYADVANLFQTVGLYRSGNHGETWTRKITADYASYQGWFAHYVRVHPEDENRIFCAGVHFYRSVDGTVFLPKSGMHVDHHAYADHPTDPDIIYFGNDGGVYRTTDRGDTFQSLNEGYVTSQFYNGFSSSPTDPNLALGGLQDNNTVMYTGSDRWRLRLIGGDGAFTAIHPLEDEILYGSAQNLYIARSGNRGASWKVITNQLPERPSCFISPFVLSPSRPETLYAGKDVVFRSSDGGDTWVTMNGGLPLNGNPIVALAVAPSDPSFLYAATIPSMSRRAEIFASRDGGLTWDNATGALPDRFYIDIQVSPRHVEEAYVTLSGFGTSHVYRTRDGGASWEDIGSGLPDVPTPALIIDPDFPDHLYVGNDLGVYVSTNSGETWASFHENLPTAVLVMDLSISASNRRIRAATHGNGVYERSLLPDSQPPSGGPEPPQAITLYPNYPNPFNPRTDIRFRLTESSFVRMTVYDARGRFVRTLTAGRYPGGEHRVHWDGKDGEGRDVPGGVYVYAIDTGKEQKTRRMTLIR